MHKPWEEMERLHEELDWMFSRMFRMAPVLEFRKGKTAVPKVRARTPVCYISETDSAIRLKCELPGVDKKDLEVNVHETSVEIKGTKQIEKEVKKEKVYRYHASASSFYRMIPLPVKISSEKSTAVYKDGVLTLSLPKEKKKLKKGHSVQIK